MNEQKLHDWMMQSLHNAYFCPGCPARNECNLNGEEASDEDCYRVVRNYLEDGEPLPPPEKLFKAKVRIEGYYDYTVRATSHEKAEEIARRIAKIEDLYDDIQFVVCDTEVIEE